MTTTRKDDDDEEKDDDDEEKVDAERYRSTYIPIMPWHGLLNGCRRR